MAQRPQAERHRSRRLLIQALYQWQLAGGEAREIMLQFIDGRDMNGADGDYFRQVLAGIGDDLARLDAAIEPLLERSLAMVDPVERAILRLAAYELFERREVPVRVVINEAVELAQVFGSAEGHRFVNGLVDRLARRVRRHELGAASHGS